MGLAVSAHGFGVFCAWIWHLAVWGLVLVVFAHGLRMDLAAFGKDLDAFAPGSGCS